MPGVKLCRWRVLSARQCGISPFPKLYCESARVPNGANMPGICQEGRTRLDEGMPTQARPAPGLERRVGAPPVECRFLDPTPGCGRGSWRSSILNGL
jgi:hypothetical protein